jgi:hypothetical protein
MGTVKFTDPFFAKAIADISAHNTLFFTPKQFFYFLNKRLRRKFSRGLPWVGFIFFTIMGIVLLFLGGIGALVFLGLAIGNLAASRSQLNSLTVRRRSARQVRILGGIIVVSSIVFGLSLTSPGVFALIIFMVSVIIGMFLIYRGTIQLGRLTDTPQSSLISPSDLQRWLQRWQQVNPNTLNKLLSPPQMLSPAQEKRTPVTVAPDLSAFSFDRAVICDRAEIAHFLVANNFYFENNCAVLSVTGYPQRVFDTVLQMLKRNPELKVYALHDASIKGVSLAHHLRTSPDWFRDSSATVIDLGLLPRHVFNAKEMFIRQESPRSLSELPAEVREELSRDELAWLEAGNFVELESFSPQKLLQIVRQGMARSRDLGSSDNLVAADTDDSASADLYIYSTMDSFG